MPEHPDSLSSSLNLDAQTAEQEAQRRLDLMDAERQRSRDASIRQQARMEMANERAAAQPLPVSSRMDAGLTLTAPTNAPDAFDYAAYQARRSTGEYVNRPGAPPPPSTQSAPPPEDRWGDRGFGAGRVDSGFINDASDPHGPWNNPDPSSSGDWRERFGAYGQQFRDRVRETFGGAGETQAATPAAFANFKEAQQRRRKIEADAKDVWARNGRAADVDGDEFKADLKGQLAEAGLAERETVGSRFRGAFKGQGLYAVGYGAMQIGQEAARYNEVTNSGAYVTPEQRTGAAAGLMPGIGSVAGALLGSVIPGVGTIAGGFVGSAVGSVAESVVGASSEREQATRQGSEALAVQLGAATSAARDFAGVIRETGVAAKDFQQVVQGAGRVAPFSGDADAVRAMATHTVALGEYAVSSGAAVDRQLRAPGLFGLADARARGGSLNGGQYDSLALIAGLNGDAEGLTEDLRNSRTARREQDPSYVAAQAARRDRDEHEIGVGSFLFAPALMFNAAKGFRGALGDRTVDRLEQEDKDNPGAQRAKDLFRDMGVLRMESGTTDARVKAEGAALQGLRAGGATAAEVESGSAGYFGALDKQAAQAQKEADRIQGLLNDPKVVGVRPELRRQLAEAQARAAEAKSGAAVGRRDILGLGLDEQEGDYALTTATDQGDLARGLRSGGSYASMQGTEDRLIADQRGRAAQLRRDADDPLLRADRGKYLAQAQQIDNAAEEQRRSFFQGGLAEETSSFGLADTKGVLGGRSAADLLHDRQRQAAFLENTALDPRNPLSPSERADMQDRAARFRYQSARDVDTEKLGWSDVAIGRAGADVGKERAFGSAASTDSAMGREVEAFQSRIAELNRELSTGTLTVADRIAKEKELTQTQQQAVQAEAQRRDERVRNTEAFAGDDFDVATAGQARQVRRGGSASVERGAVDKVWQGRLGADQFAIDQYAPGSKERKDAEAQMARDRAARDEDNDRLNVYTADVRTRMGDTAGDLALSKSEHAFRRAAEAPYTDAGGDPFSRANDLLGQLGRSEKRLSDDLGKETANRARLMKSGRWTDLAEEGYQDDLARNQERVEGLKDRRANIEHDRLEAMFGALPEMIAGGPGRGLGAALIPTAALSARFAPNASVGGWGRTATWWGTPGLNGGSPYGQAGGNMADGGAVPAAAGGANESNRYLAVIAEGIGTLVRNGLGGGAFSHTNMPSPQVGSAAHALTNGFNPNTGR